MTDQSVVNLIGSLFMVGIRGSAPGNPHLEADLDACAASGIRAVILFRNDAASTEPRNIRSPDQLRDLTSHIRDTLGKDALIAVDQEGGRVTRLHPDDGFCPAPSAREFASLTRSEQSRAATDQARQLADCGINWNLAPCTDVDHDPPCPVIGAIGRAFSSDPAVVTECARFVIEAQRSHRIASCIKHFPGHGSAQLDSHDRLPDITDTHRFESELSPFGSLINANKSAPDLAVMTAHLLHTHIDPDLPASLSPAITNDLLRDQLGFAGPIVTDSMDMGAIRRSRDLQTASQLAFAAGADLIIAACNSNLGDTASDVVATIRAIAEQATPNAIARAEKSRQRIDALAAWCSNS